MANILLRSPYYESATKAGATTAQMRLYVGGSLKYTSSKSTSSAGLALFEIAELSRDYLDIEFYGSYLPQTIAISGDIIHFDENGVQILLPYDFTHRGFDGFGYFEEGSNPTIAPNSILQSNTIVYLPDNISGVIPSEFSGNIKYNTFTPTATSITIGTTTISIERICEPKFTPMKLTFINKFGAFQDMWVFKKSTKDIKITKEKYKSNFVNTNGSYSTHKHQKKTLLAMGAESMTVNTGFIDESLNAVIKELLLSEQAWTTVEGQVLPIDISTESLTYKTRLNDKLINYTLDFNLAFDTINNIR
jgi:hypothetical protein